jgi:hypothetical protein
MEVRQPLNFDQVYSAVDGMKRATPGPFFYTRVAAKLDAAKQRNTSGFLELIARPVVAIAMVLLILGADYFALSEDSGNVEQTPVISTYAQYQQFSNTSDQFYGFDEMEAMNEESK